MKTVKYLIIVALMMMAAMNATAQAPQLINYQAVARDAAGTPLANQAVSIRFDIHDGSPTGSVQYQETQSATTNAYGLFNVQVGNGIAVVGTMASVTWSSGNKYLQVEIDPTGGSSYVDMGSQQLVSIPYAAFANSAIMGGDISGTNSAANVVKIQGSPVSTIAPTSGQVLRWTGSAWSPATPPGVAGTANYLPLFTGAATIGNSIIYQNSAAGNRIGINYGTTNHGLVAIKSANDTQALFINQTASPSASTGYQSAFGIMRLEYNGPNNNNRVGILATTIKSMSDNNGTGVEGVGNYTGVYGIGENNGAPSTGAQVMGVEGDGNGNGVYSVGVAGFATSYSSTPTNSYGVYGSAFDGTVRYGVYSDGAMHVNGALSKLSGTFKIDHPLDPENKYLSHSFVESPDMMNIYNGNVTTDATGTATVTLPDYFEALNKDFRYQLTVIGSTFAQALVSKEVSGNSFEIKTNQPGIKVSWQITGVRKDVWANTHRVVPEEEKEPFNKGRYMTPAEYGKSDDLKIGTPPHKDRKNDPSLISRSAKTEQK